MNISQNCKITLCTIFYARRDIISWNEKKISLEITSECKMKPVKTCVYEPTEHMHARGAET